MQHFKERELETKLSPQQSLIESARPDKEALMETPHDGVRELLSGGIKAFVRGVGQVSSQGLFLCPSCNELCTSGCVCVCGCVCIQPINMP